MHTDHTLTPKNDPVDALIEERPWTAFRLIILLTCFSATLMDGIHVQTMGVVGPSVARDVPMSSAGLGILMAASEFGFMLGALTLSPVTDRVGRKRMLLLSTLAFGVFSVLSAFADSLPTLLLARFFTGVGLGCAGPAVVSLATEYAPAKHRARIATLVWAANPAGSFASGLLGSLIVPTHGWRELFLAAGVLTFVFVVLIAVFVPESLRFLLLRSPHDPRVGRILRSLGARDARAIVDGMTAGRPGRPEGVPIRVLFQGANAGFTVALWASFFLCFMCLLMTLTWTVSILERAEVGVATSAMVVALNNVGGTLGVASAGWAMERFGGARLLFVTFVVGALAVLGMGQAIGDTSLLALCAAMTGLCVGGNTAGLIALAAARYPTAVRATGIGWGLAAGRLGGAVGPVVMGLVAGSGASPTALFSVIAIPAGLAAVTVLPLCRRERSTGGDVPLNAGLALT